MICMYWVVWYSIDTSINPCNAPPQQWAPASLIRSRCSSTSPIVPGLGSHGYHLSSLRNIYTGRSSQNAGKHMENMHGKWKIINPKIDGMKVDEHENGLNIEQSRCQISFFLCFCWTTPNIVLTLLQVCWGVSWMRHREAPVIVLQSFATSHRCPVALNSATR